MNTISRDERQAEQLFIPSVQAGLQVLSLLELLPLLGRHVSFEPLVTHHVQRFINIFLLSVRGSLLVGFHLTEDVLTWTLLITAGAGEIKANFTAELVTLCTLAPFALLPHCCLAPLHPFCLQPI